MLYAAYSLFLLRKLSFEHFEFPRWQAILGVTLIGVLGGISASFSPDVLDIVDEFDFFPHQSSALMLLFIAVGIVMVLVYYLIFVPILCWWMKRSNRFDGQGNLFNLVIASGLVCSLLSIVLSFVGDSDSVGLTLLLKIVGLALSLYAYWVLANALSGAIPKASLGYSIGGIIIAIIASVIIMIIPFVFILGTFLYILLS